MIWTRKRKERIEMTILLVLNSQSARNVQLLIRLPNAFLEKRFRRLMDAKMYKEAFELVYSKSQPGEYYFLDPNKMHYIRPPAYILVEGLIAASKSKEASVV